LRILNLAGVLFVAEAPRRKEAIMFRNTLFIILIAVVLVFVIQNTQVVEFQFLFWTFTISRALMLFSTLAVGIIAGWLMAFPKRRQQKVKSTKK
jgi:uncharacterized integral membrane protein